MNGLRIGVIGAGGRGRIAKHCHKPENDVSVVACCDINSEVKDWCQETYGTDIFFTEDYKKLLEQKLDAVFICSPDFLHEEQAVATLAKGMGVYLEKPMAITIEGCDRILTTARENNARLFVGHNMRYMNIIRKMKKLIDDGAIGTPKSVWCRHFINYGGDAYFRDWHSEARYSTGLLLQKGAHDIDVMHWLAGAYSKRVSAFGNLTVYNKLPRLADGEKGCADFNNAHWPPKSLSGFSQKIDVEDQTVMIMEMENDIIGSYTQCHFSPDCCRNYTFIGDAGRIENIGDGADSPIMLFNKRKGYRMIGDEVHYGDPVAAGGHGGADPVIVEEFIDFIRNGSETTATPEAARMSVAAGCQATASLRNGGQAMDVPPLP